MYSIDRGLRKDYRPQDHHFLISSRGAYLEKKGDPLLCGCGYADQLVVFIITGGEVVLRLKNWREDGWFRLVGHSGRCRVK